MNTLVRIPSITNTVGYCGGNLLYFRECNPLWSNNWRGTGYFRDLLGGTFRRTLLTSKDGLSFLIEKLGSDSFVRYYNHVAVLGNHVVIYSPIQTLDLGHEDSVADVVESVEKSRRTSDFIYGCSVDFFGFNLCHYYSKRNRSLRLGVPFNSRIKAREIFLLNSAPSLSDNRRAHRNTNSLSANALAYWVKSRIPEAITSVGTSQPLPKGWHCSIVCLTSNPTMGGTPSWVFFFSKQSHQWQYMTLGEALNDRV